MWSPFGTALTPYLNSRSVCEISLRALRVIERAVSHRTVRSAYDKFPAVEMPAGPIPVFRRFIHYLVESREYVIRKLDLSESSAPSNSHSYREPHDALLTEGRVEHPLRPVLVSQSLSASIGNGK